MAVIPVNNMHNFLCALPEEIQAEFDRVSTFSDAQPGETLVRAGDFYHHLYQLCKGSVRCSSCDHQGRETIAAFMKDGDWIGLSETFSSLPSAVDVVVLSPLRLRAVKHRDFMALLDRYPAISRHLLRQFSLRFSAMFRSDIDNKGLTMKERLLKTLYLLSVSHGRYSGDELPVHIDISQEELSKLVGAPRQNMNRILKDLEREGLLHIGYGTIRLRGTEDIAERYGYLVNVAQPVPAYLTGRA
ncbi:MAG: Crp/Fnr family transcriptional regulator [Nitrospira sp.]|nr:Crp/Fnr family transcriptional regulator [Nitrospira sp.]